jgi:hypothetical protein
LGKSFRFKGNWGYNGNFTDSFNENLGNNIAQFRMKMGRQYPVDLGFGMVDLGC